MSSANFLLEIGTEELPPKALPTLSRALQTEFQAALHENHIAFVAIQGFATPRRLALAVQGIESRQPDRTEQRRGPSVAAAFDADGQPTKAALGFARSCGVEVTALERLSLDEGEWLVFERNVAGRPLTDLIGDMTTRALSRLPIPKRMRWGSQDHEFVRPVHWVVALLDDAIVDLEVFGIKSGRNTRGHRFHHPQEIPLMRAEEYADLLESPGHVIASFERRRTRIQEDVLAHCTKLGLVPDLSEPLLDEVTALVEWPVVLSGEFDPRYLKLPDEVLVSTMQGHQKYFPVRDPDGALSNRFITVSNIQSQDPAVVQAGNERVIRPRLADAEFFYESDRAHPLAQWRPALSSMLFEKRLGSLLDKTERIERLVSELAPSFDVDPGTAVRTAHLSRCDLMSDMVGEFPELQGSMGAYYAASTESAEVCRALGEFYQPRYSGDAIPASGLGRCIALADKIDTLVGIFGAGLLPTGDRDPYGLRRAALGALRILVEGGAELALDQTVDLALAAYRNVALEPETRARVLQFMRDRLRGYFLEHSFAADVCSAVLTTDEWSPLEMARRAAAVARFRQLPEAEALAAANKRIANILRKAPADLDGHWDLSLLQDDAERDLAQAVKRHADAMQKMVDSGQYDAYLEQLAALRDPVDNFFDTVMVMSDDTALRRNRLLLLRDLFAMFSRVADISQLHGE